MKNFIRNQNLLAVVAVALFVVLSNLWIATFPLDQGDNVAAVGVAVAPKVAKVSVVGTPYLAFGINPITREESLNGQIKVNVTALPNQDAYIVKRGAFNPHASEIDVISGPLPYPNLRDSVHGIVTYKPDSLANIATSSLVGANMDAYVIKKGKTVTFTIDVKFNPRQMYGGSYKMFIEEAYVGTIDTSGNAVQDVKVVPLGKRVSNKVVIFGETSPYVSGSASKENQDGSTGLIALFGVRFDTELKLYANNKYVKTLTSTSTTRQGIRQVTFNASELGLASDSNVSLQVESSKNGKSNIVYQNVVVPKVFVPSVISVKTPSVGSVFDNGPTQNINVGWDIPTADFEYYEVYAGVKVGDKISEVLVGGDINKSSNGFTTTSGQMQGALQKTYGANVLPDSGTGYYFKVNAINTLGKIVATGKSGEFSIKLPVVWNASSTVAVDLVSTDSQAITVDGPNNDRVEFSIKFNATAMGEKVIIPKNVIFSTSTSVVDSIYVLVNSSSGGLVSGPNLVGYVTALQSTNNPIEETDKGFILNNNQKGQFTLKVVFTNTTGNGNFYRMKMLGIDYGPRILVVDGDIFRTAYSPVVGSTKSPFLKFLGTSILAWLGIWN